MTLDLLIPEFREKVETVLAELQAAGFELRPYCTIRDPFEQAIEWRKGVTSQQIAAACANLRSVGAPRIAKCIESVGAQRGRKVTNAMPGFSWHQFGEAVDCVLITNKRADWDASAQGWVEYARIARKHGLKPGRDFHDSPHIQFRHHEPHHVFEIARLDNMMAARFPSFAALGA